MGLNKKKTKTSRAAGASCYTSIKNPLPPQQPPLPPTTPPRQGPLLAPLLPVPVPGPLTLGCAPLFPTALPPLTHSPAPWLPHMLPQICAHHLFALKLFAPPLAPWHGLYYCSSIYTTHSINTIYTMFWRGVTRQGVVLTDLQSLLE